MTWPDDDDRYTGVTNLRAANREAARLLSGGDAPVVASHTAGEPGDELKLDLESFTGVGLVYEATEGNVLRTAVQRLAAEAGTVPHWVTSPGGCTIHPD